MSNMMINESQSQHETATRFQRLCLTARYSLNLIQSWYYASCKQNCLHWLGG